MLAVRGRLSDLIVAARSGGKGDAQRTTLEIALLETGRPVLLAPPPWQSAGISARPISIAWNGSIEAVRAIGAGAGLHFLGEAEQGRRHGRARGVPSRPRMSMNWSPTLPVTTSRPRSLEIDESSRPIGRVLLEKSKEVGADMMVMGAYTHSRLRHMMLGGPTSVVLQNAEIPVLMAH